MHVKLEDKTYEAKEFFDLKLNQALRAAQKYTYTCKNGFVAGMPQLIIWKENNPTSPLWNNNYTTTTEEHIIPDSTGRFGKKGKPLILVTQNNGIFTPQRIEQAHKQGLINGAARLTPKECHTLLHAPHTIPFEQFKNHHPEPYTIVLTREQAEAHPSGRLSRQEFIINPRVRAWTGEHPLNLYTYFNIAHWHNKVGVWYDKATTNTPKGRVLFLRSDNNGLYANGNLDNH